MPKKEKMKTPDWIIKGYDSKADYEKARQKAEPLASSSESQTKGIKSEKKTAKTFKIRECPKCGSDDVGLVLSNKYDKGEERLESGIPSGSSESQAKEWECHKCKWKGKDINEKELTEDEFMKYLDEKGEEVA